jgi:hypothetical protein
MKLYTACYFEPEEHVGRPIGISGSKPKNIKEEYGYDCELCHEWLSPDQIYWDYIKDKKAAGDDEKKLKQASENFVSRYKARLQDFRNELEKISKETGKTFQEIIGFEEGDTLLSWERGGNTSYREEAASFLRELGYDVEER